MNFSIPAVVKSCSSDFSPLFAAVKSEVSVTTTMGHVEGTHELTLFAERRNILTFQTRNRAEGSPLRAPN